MPLYPHFLNLLFLSFAWVSTITPALVISLLLIYSKILIKAATLLLNTLQCSHLSCLNN